MTILNRLLFLCTLFVFISSAGNAAYANCSDPAGKAGTMDYFTSDGVYKFCDGTDWHSMKGGAASGDDVASKDYVDAAVAAGGGGGPYTPPTQYMFTSTTGNGTQADDICNSESADGGGWRLGSTRDLYFFALNGQFPVPSGAAWITVIPQPEIPLASGNSSTLSVYYAARDGFNALDSGDTRWRNCYGWSSNIAAPIATLIESDYSMGVSNCNYSSNSFCVK